jgi:hypothetical protein
MATYKGETKHDRVRFSVQERFPDGWHSIKLFAQRENAEHFASTLVGNIRIMRVD